MKKCFCAFLQPSKGILRQVDIIFVPPEELGTAILGWTGSRQFERSLRDYAKKVIIALFFLVYSLNVKHLLGKRADCKQSSYIQGNQRPKKEDENNVRKRRF